jgi:hypothetical protein
LELVTSKCNSVLRELGIPIPQEIDDASALLCPHCIDLVSMQA